MLLTYSPGTKSHKDMAISGGLFSLFFKYTSFVILLWFPYI